MMPNDLPVLVLDEGICFPLLREAIRNEGVRCEFLIDHFERGTPDAQWLPGIGDRGWILLSKDLAIKKNTIEYHALMNANIGAFFIRSREISGREIADCVVKAIPKMLEIIRTQRKPFLYKIYKDGSVTLWQ
jgi:hypothetical protein